MRWRPGTSQSERCGGGPESHKVSDDLAEKGKRCAVGSHGCYSHGMEDTAGLTTVQAKYELLRPLMDERTRRQWAASEALSLKRGGVTVVAKATGLSRTTIGVGMRELRERTNPDYSPPAARWHRPGKSGAWVDPRDDEGRPSPTPRGDVSVGVGVGGGGRDANRLPRRGLHGRSAHRPADSQEMIQVRPTPRQPHHHPPRAGDHLRRHLDQPRPPRARETFPQRVAFTSFVEELLAARLIERLGG